MTCKTIDKLLAGYINQSLKPREMTEVEAHLKNCDQCRQNVERLNSCCAKLKQSLSLYAGDVKPPLDDIAVIRQKAGIDKAESNIPGQHSALMGISLSFCTLFLTFFMLVPFLAGAALPPPGPPAMVNDGSGGVYLYWQTGGKQYEQHIDADGNLLWGNKGREITGKDPSFDIKCCMDNAQQSVNYFQRINSMRFWMDKDYSDRIYKLYVQKENADDNHAWLRQKTEVYRAPPFHMIGYSNIISDEQGGVIIASRATDGSKISSTYDVYAIRIDSNGDWVWGESGVLVQKASSAPTMLLIAGIAVIIASLLSWLLWLGNHSVKMLAPIASLALFYVGLRSIWLMVRTSVGLYTDGWKFVLDTPLNGAAIWLVFISGLILAIVWAKKTRINQWLMLPVFLPYLLLAGLVIWFNIGSLI